MSRYFQQVPMKITHDWAKTIAVSKKFVALEPHAQAETFPPNAGIKGSAHFDLKSLGVLGKNYLSESWYTMVGPAITKTMPWLPMILEDMRDLGPDSGAISFLSGDAAEHIDQPKDLSALNYIFHSTDLMAHTYVGNEQYPSLVDTAWIIDATVPHGIRNAGERWSLSIHFSAPYSELKSWCEKHLVLAYGP